MDGLPVASPDTSSGGRSKHLGMIPALILGIGVLLLAVPTMIDVISEGWTGEMGAHAPLILATGCWLLVYTIKNLPPSRRRPSLRSVMASLAILLPLYVFARITQIVEIEGFMMYACLVILLWSIVGTAALRAAWFPLTYLLFIFPPPETIVAAITLPLKLWISEAAVGALSFVGYPIGGQGVIISIGQYQLLVAAACAGLNTILTLSAISLFYAYAMHRADPRYVLTLGLLVVPIALFANFVRVIILILLTYHFGEATGQGFLHNFAGIFMFLVALGAMFATDSFLQRWRSRKSDGQHG